MYVRTSAGRAERSRLDEAITFLRDEVTPSVLAADGCTGVSLLVDRESGRLQLTSSWRDRAAEEANEPAVQGLRERAGQILTARPEVTRYEAVGMHRARPTPQGAVARVTWALTDRSDAAEEFFHGTLAPALEQQPGFCSASMFLDRSTGQLVVTAAYADRAALQESRSFAQRMRSSAVQEVGLRIDDIGEYDVEMAHLRVPETV